MVARIKGDVSEAALREAVAKARQRHTNVRARIVEGEDGALWLTSDGAGAITVEVIPRESNEHWVRVHHEITQRPFDFDERPPVRFVLLQDAGAADLLISCHHIICDGLSLAYLARDILSYLGDPAQEVEVLPDPLPVSVETIPSQVSLNALVRFFINRINRKWQADAVTFDLEDYRSIAAAYWANFQHRVIPIELTEDQTTALVERCRAEGVTVNSALAAAFAGAQVSVLGEQPYLSKIGVAASLRDRLREPAGEAMGFFAGVASVDFRYDIGSAFWENARRFHARARSLYTDRNLFGDFAAWSYLEPTYLEAFTFKKLGRLVPLGDARHAKLAAFSQQQDAVLSQLKRDKMDMLDEIFMGAAITNLTRMDFPREYGALELDRLLMQPGGAFPLANVGLVLGAVTCSGKLSMLVEYAEQAVDTPTMERIREQALTFLWG